MLKKTAPEVAASFARLACSPPPPAPGKNRSSVSIAFSAIKQRSTLVCTSHVEAEARGGGGHLDNRNGAKIDATPEAAATVQGTGSVSYGRQAL